MHRKYDVADKLGKELNMNFSKTLTEAIIRQKLEQ